MEKILEYKEKMENSSTEKKRNYYKEGMQILFEEGENLKNIEQVYAEYKDAFSTRKNMVDKLYEEIRIIKKLKV